MQTETSTSVFETAFNSWLEGAQKKVDDYWAKNKYTYAQSPILKAEFCTRYVRVYAVNRDKDGNETPDNGRRIHAFIDLTGGLVMKKPSKIGDVYKPASWQAPAKHARGNIFDEHNGLKFVNYFGPVYLR